MRQEGFQQGLLPATPRIALVKRRIADIQRQRADGRASTEIVEAAKPPLLVQLISESKEDADGSGARVRRTEALALHNEGMTMERIAERFGVTRHTCCLGALPRSSPAI